MEIDRTKVQEIYKQISTDRISYDAAQILSEINSLIQGVDIPKSFVYRCVELALDVFLGTLHATAAGVGMVVGNWLLNHCDPQKRYTDNYLRSVFQAAHRDSELK